MTYKICFYGTAEQDHVTGRWKSVGADEVEVQAYDIPVPGYKTKNTISLRLWSAVVRPADFDLAAFNAGEYAKAVAKQQFADRLCAVLYPGDGTDEGKILRLASRGISLIGRVTQGVKLMDAEAEEQVVSLAKVAEQSDDSEAETEPDLGLS